MNLKINNKRQSYREHREKNINKDKTYMCAYDFMTLWLNGLMGNPHIVIILLIA